MDIETNHLRARSNQLVRPWWGQGYVERNGKWHVKRECYLGISVGDEWEGTVERKERD